MDTVRLNRRVVLGLSRLLLAGLLLAALLPSAGILADDPPTSASSDLGELGRAVEPAPADLPADVWASVLAQIKKLTAADGAPADQFGYSVGISGDTIVVGAPFHDVGGNANQGSAYVFGRDQGGANQWGLIKELSAAAGAAGDQFGWSVGVDGDTIVVGANQRAVGGNSYQGAAYVFYRNQGGVNAWGQVKQLTAGDGAPSDYFGQSIAISGDTVVVGAAYDSVGGKGAQGSAYVFYRNQGGADQWGQVTQLIPGDGAASDYFGLSVAISGDTVVVGSPRHDVGGNMDQGSAYVYQRNWGGADAWGQVRQLLAGDGAAEDYFGSSVAIGGDTVVVGSPGYAVGGNDNQGSAYVFCRDQGGVDQWGQARQLVAGDGAGGDYFGLSVAIDGDSIVAGAPYDNAGGNEYQGSAYLFRRNQGGADQWGQVRKLTAGDGEAGNEFGWATAIDGATVVVGAHYDAVSSNNGQGSAYIFKDAPAKLKLRKTDQRDPLPAGWIVRYTISVTNASQVALPLITVVDTLPYKTVFVQADQGYRRSGNRVTWKLTNVPAGTTRELSLWVRTYSTMRGYILNQVTATSEGVTVKAGQSTLIVAPTSGQQPAEELPPAN